MSWQMMSDLGSEPVRTQLKVCLSWEFCCHFSMLKMLLTLPGHQVPAVPGRGLQVTAGLVWAAMAPGLGCQGSWFGLPGLLFWAAMAPALGYHGSCFGLHFLLSPRAICSFLSCDWSCSAHRMEPGQILTWMVLDWLGMCKGKHREHMENMDCTEGGGPGVQALAASTAHPALPDCLVGEG